MRLLVRATFALLAIAVGAFVTGLASYAGLALFGGFSEPTIWLTFAGWTVAGVFLLPFAVVMVADPFAVLCSSDDHITEILLPLQLAGPAVVFATVCAITYLVTRWDSSFPVIVARASAISVPTFILLHAVATALLTVFHAGCPPPTI
jgi:hypothetical protein